MMGMRTGCRPRVHRVWLAVLAACAAWTYAAAAAPGPAGYQHTRWTQENGAPPQINKMAQTADGWLWLGTDQGLYRFDGVGFQHYAPPQLEAFAQRRVIGMHAHGTDLYVSYFPHAVVLLHRDGRVDVQPPLPPTISLGEEINAIDGDGSLWMAGDAVLHLAHGRWTVADDSAEWPRNDTSSGLVDQDGRLWMANPAGVWRLDRARGRFEKVEQRGGDLMQAPDGAVWLLAAQDGGAVRLAPSASGKPRSPSANPSLSGKHGLIDANGALWSLNGPDTVCVVRGAAARRAVGACGGNAVADAGRQGTAILEDSEGDIWIATATGLERYRAKRFLSTGLERGGGAYSLAVDGEMHAWAADRDDGTLWRLRPGEPAQREPWAHVQVLSSGADGALLLGGKQAIWRRTRAGVETIALPPGPDGKPVDHNMLGILDDGKVLWTTTYETGTIGWIGGKWLRRDAFNLPPMIYLSAAAGGGRMWLATLHDGLVFHDNGKLTRYDASAIGTATAMFPGAEFLIGGERGFAVMKHGRLELLHAAEPGVLRSVSGLAATADGDRWLNGAAGVVHVRAADWRRALDRPAEPLRYELFGTRDGYPGRAGLQTRLHTAFSADGRHLWFLGTGGVVGLDSANLRHNPVAPQPAVLDVATEDARFVPPAGTGAALRLPPGSSSFRIQFTAPSLREPERIRFQYRLDGVDERWQDAGTRRSTSYTNVGPGDYVFRVRAVNEDGVASRADAVLPLTVAPTLVQSLPFKAACAVVLLALATLLYRLRVAYLTRRATERLQVKLVERERIARTLHDTILQSVQALMLRLDALSSRLPQGDSTRAALDTMLRDAGSAIGAGRDQVRELRAAAVPSLEDIARAGAAELQALHPQAGFELRMAGPARDLLPAVADEAGHIVLEAMRNAFTHARARHIAVHVDHGRRTLSVAVADDGCGMDADVARDGYRSGHWGLIGMRERATRIGGRLDIASRAGHGTTITLTVPAARAYA